MRDHHNGLPGLGLSPFWQVVTAITGGLATGATTVAQKATVAPLAAPPDAGALFADMVSPWWTPLIPLAATWGVPVIVACLRFVDQKREIVKMKWSYEAAIDRLREEKEAETARSNAESARLNAEIAANRAEIARLNREQEAEREQIERARCLFADPDGVARCRRETTEITTDDIPPATDGG